MPYIDPMRRVKIIEFKDRPKNAGELNFCFTSIINEYLKFKAQPRYEDFNACIGALECAKQELYRTMIAKYEDEKKEENGGIY